MSMLSEFLNLNHSGIQTGGIDFVQANSALLNANNDALLQLIDSLSSGDTLLGKVLSSSDQVMEIMTQNGVSVSADNPSGILLEPGTNVIFEVSKNNKNEVSLKPLAQNMSQQLTGESALKEAGIPVNERTLTMVLKNMEYALPIDRSSIQSSYKDVYNFPNTSVSTVVDLQFMNIPVNQNNISSYEAYRNMQHSVTDAFFDIADSMSECMVSFDWNKVMTTVNEFLSSMKEVFDGNDVFSPRIDLKELENLSVESKVPLTNLKTILSKPQLSLESLAEAISLDFSNVEEDFTKELLLKSGMFKKLINDFLLNQWSFKNPEDISEEGIKDLYERLFSQSEKMNTVFSKLGEEFTPVKELSNHLSDNLSFMNALNTFVPYVQIPLSFENNQKAADLYVFSNKKTLASNSGEISAFIHLDMDHLGPTDVFVILNDNHVSTHFTLASDESLDLIEANMDFLNKRLTEKGYSLEAKFEISNQNESPIAKTLELLSHKPLISNISFDARI